jgi:hypothetical protein
MRRRAERQAGRIFGRSRRKLSVEVVGLVGVNGRLKRRVYFALEKFEPFNFLEEGMRFDFLGARGSGT